MSTRPDLHVVEPATIAPEAKPIDPDRRLRALFRAEARLLQQLLDIRRDLGIERKRYAEKHNLGFFPPIDRLRRLLG
jgi:hypothetical protein